MALIFVVDDEENMCKVLKFCLESDGHEVFAFSDPGEALTAMKGEARRPDVIVSDLKMPTMSGLEFLAEVRKQDSQLPFIIMTAFATVKNAVEAMKEGAFDYILKPFEPEELKILITKAMEHARLVAENQALKSLEDDFSFIGESPAMASVRELIASVAASKTTVLITGESGTGKELIAKSIHAMSDRAHRPFVKINCAAIPDNLLESELFGHKKGSFTGAVCDKIGKFELADTGTIFLDEIGDMNLNLQAKLLRVLQEKQFEKVGDNRSITVDIRIVAATNQNLQKHIRDGAFREDLYYRLNVFPIRVPPLRERREDIILLARHFVKKFNHEFKKNVETISDRMTDALVRYDFPGNIRELSNIVEREMILARGSELDLAHELFAAGEEAKPGTDNAQAGERHSQQPPQSGSLEQIERQHIVDVLKSTGWHKGKTAEILGIDRSTLYRMMKKYDIDRGEN